MNPELYRRVSEIFAAARRLRPDQRSAYLDDACAADVDLRSHVESFLAQDESTQSVLEPEAVRGSLGRLAAESLSEEQSSEIPEVIGGYRIVEEIARGGMGIVYLAEQNHPKRKIALKVIRPELVNRQTLRRFEHEAYLLGQLQHAGIAQVYEAGVADIRTEQGVMTRQPFFAMEFIRGEPLNEYVEKRKLGIRPRLELLARICDAVHHAHQKGMVHRDLKPANLLVVAHAESSTAQQPDQDPTPVPFALGQPKILDFGIARATDSDLQNVTLQTDIGKLIGTVPYMSPEQVTGRSNDLDTRSDIYALGVIMFELLTGNLPYDIRDCSVPEAVRTICDKEPSRLGSVDSRLRGDAEIIAAKALEKDRDRRYGSAAELAADIRRHLRDEPIVARTPSAIYQLSKFARRNKAVVTGATAACVALLLGAGFSIWFGVREFRQRQVAEKRFNDVRQLASTFIFDINEKIERLPGSTEARETLVKTSLRYLNELAKDSEGDPDLLFDLANAYRKVGELQGRPDIPNLGDTAGALVSFQKSFAILNDLVEDRSDESRIQNALFLTLIDLGVIHAALGDPDKALASCVRAQEIAVAGHASADQQSMSLYRIGRIYERTGRHARALAAYLESHELRQAALAAAPENTGAIRGVSVTFCKIGDMYASRGALAEALVQYDKSHSLRERLVEAHPHDGAAKRYLSITHGRMGEALSRMDRMEEAVLHYEAYRDLRAELAEADARNVNAQRDLAVSFAKLGELYHVLGRSDEALKDYGRAVAILRALSDADPANFQRRFDFASIHFAANYVRAELGQNEAALAGLRECLPIMQDLAQANPGDLHIAHALAGAHATSGHVLHGMNRLEEAVDHLRKGLSMRESLVANNKEQVMFKQDLVETLQWLGEAHVSMARSGHENSGLRSWREARSCFHRAREMAAGLQGVGAIGLKLAEIIKDLDSRIDQCDQAMNNQASAQSG